MNGTVQLYALIAGAALLVLPASNLAAAPQLDDAVAAQVQEHLDRGDQLAAKGHYGSARREYRAAAELERAEGKLPATALRRIANSYYYQDRYQQAGKMLENLAREASTYGDLVVQVWAVADAAWVAWIAGDKIDMERRLERLHRLMTSPYLPDEVREEIQTKRLASAPPSGRKLAFLVNDP